jgi:hypothetical protein
MHANDNNRRRTCGRKPLTTTCANMYASQTRPLVACRRRFKVEIDKIADGVHNMAIALAGRSSRAMPLRTHQTSRSERADS